MLFGKGCSVAGMSHEQLLHEALTHAEFAACIFDDERRFRAVNNRFLEVTGFTIEEVEDHRAGDTLRLSPLNQDEYMRLVASGVSVGEAEIVQKNGRTLVVDYVVIPTNLGGERLYIGMMWPLHRGNHRPMENAAQ